MQIALNRLISQCLYQSHCTSPERVVQWLCAMQAQDFEMVKWAVGCRYPNSTLHQVEQALSEGRILRTHLLRPTWHLTTAEDIRWLLRLTAPQIRQTSQSRHRELELTPELLERSNRTLTAILRGKSLRRDDVVAQLKAAGIPVDQNRSSHLLMCAELDEIICSGHIDGRHTTYALLDERVPDAVINFNRADAVIALARRYFQSHAPATLDDFMWWSGLRSADCRSAIPMLQEEFKTIRIDDADYYYSPEMEAFPALNKSVLLLPAFDEFIISYRNRSASITDHNHKRAVSENGLFRPMIAVDGVIAGIWKRDKKKIEKEYFSADFDSAQLEMEERRYQMFV